MSDYDRWFIGSNGVAIKCKRERFIDCLKDMVGATEAARRFKEFRKVTFSEQCRLELELMED